MRRFDEWVLGRYERVAHGLQSLTGLNNFWLARIALRAVAVSYLFCAVTPFRPENTVQPGEFEFRFKLCVVLCVATFMVAGPFLKLVRQLEAHYEEGSRTAHPMTLICRGLGSLRLGFAAIHVMFGFFAGAENNPASGWYWLHQAAWFQAISVLYLIAIIPLPPGRSKLGKLIENIRFAFSRPSEVRLPSR